MATYWQYIVVALTLQNLLTDILSRKQLMAFAFLSGVINVIGWMLLLGTKAPFARSITLYAIMSYVLTFVVAAIFFKEGFSTSQLIGFAFGAIAVILLA